VTYGYEKGRKAPVKRSFRPCMYWW